MARQRFRESLRGLSEDQLERISAMIWRCYQAGALHRRATDEAIDDINRVLFSRNPGVIQCWS